jgi:hypothetical protein
MKIMRPAPVEVWCKRSPLLLIMMMESKVPAQISSLPTLQKQLTGCADSSLLKSLAGGMVWWEAVSMRGIV